MALVLLVHRWHASSRHEALHEEVLAHQSLLARGAWLLCVCSHDYLRGETAGLGVYGQLAQCFWNDDYVLDDHGHFIRHAHRVRHEVLQG